MVVQYDYICIRHTSRRALPQSEVPEVLLTHTSNRKNNRFTPEFSDVHFIPKFYGDTIFGGGSIKNWDNNRKRVLVQLRTCRNRVRHNFRNCASSFLSSIMAFYLSLRQDCREFVRLKIVRCSCVILKTWNVTRNSYLDVQLNLNAAITTNCVEQNHRRITFSLSHSLACSLALTIFKNCEAPHTVAKSEIGNRIIDQRWIWRISGV